MSPNFFNNVRFNVNSTNSHPERTEVMDFEKELEALLNKYSQENKSDTPDFVLAEYLTKCLWAFNIGVNLREKWYGREPSHYYEIKDKEDKL